MEDRGGAAGGWGGTCFLPTEALGGISLGGLPEREGHKEWHLLTALLTHPSVVLCRWGQQA